MSCRRNYGAVTAVMSRSSHVETFIETKFRNVDNGVEKFHREYNNPARRLKSPLAVND